MQDINLERQNNVESTNAIDFYKIVLISRFAEYFYFR